MRRYMRDHISFVVNGESRMLRAIAPDTTLLNYLRRTERLTGTKEGCAEGDCGACTVVVGELRDGQVEMRSVNACIQLLPTLDGKALFTVEDLKQENGALHPVQQALVECHGSQCGFCTPGFAMSLWGLYLERGPATGPPTERQITDALSGNLCRCTGYRPIIEAARRMGQLPAPAFDRIALADTLRGLQRDSALSATVGGRTFHAPRTVAELLTL